MITKHIETLLRWWKPASGAAHLLIALLAALASADIIKPSNTFLAILIAWANVCTALHRAGDDLGEK